MTWQKKTNIFFIFIFSDVVKVVNLQGKLKSNKKQASELFFDFPINNIGKLIENSKEIDLL